MTARDTRNKRLTAGVLVAVVGGMVALTAASVPLYRLFCQVTGYGGTTQVATAPSRVVDQYVTIRFNADREPGLPWRFRPMQREIKVRLGETAVAFFEAENTGDAPITGTATYNVTPFKAGPYFSKIECFCFTEQTLAPGERAQMPVSFFVDADMLDDWNVADVKTITLSYTFYRARANREVAQVLPADRPAD